MFSLTLYRFILFQLRTYFSQWGPVVDAIVIRDQTTKQSRGFGFVTFATINSAEAAMLDRPHVIGGKTVCFKRCLSAIDRFQVDSKRAIPREQMAPMMPPPFFECDPAPGCKLLLSGIHWDFHTVEALRLYFEKFGSLDQIEGNPRGVGFVIYEDKDSADKCLAHNGGRHIVNDRKVEVRVGFLLRSVEKCIMFRDRCRARRIGVVQGRSFHFLIKWQE